MSVNRGIVEAYGIMIEHMQRNAGRVARASVKKWLKANPTWDAADLRAAAALAVSEAVGEYGLSASSLACDLYDECMLGEGFKADPAEPWDGDSNDEIVRAVRYQLQKALDGDIEAFLAAIDAMTQYYVRLCANNTTIQNVERDNNARIIGGMSSDVENEAHGSLDLPTSYGKTRRYTPRRNYKNTPRRVGDVAYARVPTGAETCTYCMMLASRGFVYRSAESAGHADHRGCNCMIVAGRYGLSTVDGIDQDAQYECWRELEALEAYANKHPDEIDAEELERRKVDVVKRYDNITLSTDPAEVRKHASGGVLEWYEPRERMASNYRGT